MLLNILLSDHAVWENATRSKKPVKQEQINLTGYIYWPNIVNKITCIYTDNQSQNETMASAGKVELSFVCTIST